MPKHIRAKIKTGPLSLETCSAFLSNLFNLKKINSPDALPPSHRRLLLGDYITGRRGVICDLDCSLYPCTTHRLCFYIVESSKPSFDRVILSVPSPPPPSACSWRDPTLQQTGGGPWEGMCAPWSYHRSHRPCSNLTPRLETQRHSVQRFLHRQFAFPLQPYDGARVAYLKFVIYRNRPNVI